MIRFKDDRGSLPLAMLVSVIGVGLSVFMSMLVLSQLHTTAYEARRLQALNAAQAGLDVGVGQVRSATKINSSGETVGDAAKLPCAALTGTVGRAAYSVSARYYDSDPQVHLQDTAWITAHTVACVAGTGTRAVPRFVVFTSTGTASDAGSSSRTLRGTYVVHTDNANISGGLVHVYRDSTALNDLCIDAGPGTPSAGTAVTMQLCTAGAVSQTWSYDLNLRIVLVSSQSSTSAGLCLQAGTTHAPRTAVTLQPCVTTKPALYAQQWSINNSSNLVGSNSTGTDIDSYCFNVAQANKPGSALIITTSCSGTYNNVSTFSFDADAGAGQASSAVGQAVGQLVNYSQFGRCLDDTNQNPAWTFMIAWPCKQNPDPTKVEWNQRYTLPVLDGGAKVGTSLNFKTGTISTVQGTAKYCLQSPLKADLYQYVTTKSCVPDAVNQRWTVYGLTDAYATSYEIVDGAGLCLQPRDQNASPPDLFQDVNKVAKIYVAPCDGSTLQKWNANKDDLAGVPLKDVTER
ncbi:ricin-type beta-trefoil lectin domain protein [Actinoplanes sp. NPDC051411]|uniref:ricin-type beta-trefoil lectin domain protein n=1 Tax=Actinoplanes sp. NPDC051411 TaxID=3155522 RepID=UPI003424AF13